MRGHEVQFDLIRRRCSVWHSRSSGSPWGSQPGLLRPEPRRRAFAADVAYRRHNGMERSAEMLAEPFGGPVPAGFAASCPHRFSTRWSGSRPS